MFAFAYYDKKTQDLSVVRDQLGIKPIYYLETSESIIFSSEIKPILRYSGVKVELNNVALSDHILLRLLPAKRDVVLNILTGVPEGSHLLVRG